MVFQMLKDLMGRERFYESIRHFTDGHALQKGVLGGHQKSF